MTTPADTTTKASGSRALLADATTLGGVELTVTDLDRSLRFYTEVIGLVAQERDRERAVLGPGEAPLITLHVDPNARPAGRHAGLYHVALLFPSREELARAGRRVAERRVPIDGASDHGTHEAIYLPDTDGIGIELAADWPRERWPDLRGADLFAHGPAPLDGAALFATVAGEGAAPRAEPGLRIGHVHLHVADLDAATRFYRDGLGFEVMMRLPSATFVAAGGYHHHVAYNLWRGSGVPPAPAEGVVGLRRWTLVADGPAELDAMAMRLDAIGAPLRRDGAELLARDPDGIAVALR